MNNISTARETRAPGEFRETSVQTYARIAGVLLLLTLIGGGFGEAYVPSRLLAGSLALSLFVYVIVNGGMIAGLLPVVGVPMPLLSYGGTSAVSLLAGLGVVMAVRAHKPVHGH